MTETKIVVKALIANSNKVLIIRRSKTDTRRPLQWDIPGGAVEANETIYESVSREINEETGINIPPDKLHLIYSKTERRDFANVVFLFMAGESRSLEIKLSLEHDQYLWLPIEEAISNIQYPLHKEFFEYVRNNKLLG